MAGVHYSTPILGKTAPWAGGGYGEHDVLPGGDMLNAAAFPTKGSVGVVVSGSAAQGATSVPVSALSDSIPSGATLDFGGAKFARLTSGAAAGATTLTVAALPTALAANDAATYQVGGAKRFVENGTLLGRTIGERNDGEGYGPYESGDTDVYLLLYDVADADGKPECALYRHGSIVYEGQLPASSKTSAALTVIRNNYETTV